MFASKDTLLTRPSGGYNIARSVRFRSSASGYFSRTPASSGNLTTWTFSAWVKLGTIGVARCLFSCGANTSNVTSIDLRADHRIQLYTSTAGGQVASLVWNPNVYRDPSAWYHFVIVADTTNATSTNRYKFYVNNVQVTGISTTAGEDNFGAQNAATNVNSTVAHSLGRKQASANEYFDGYVTEVNLIDGQALTPSLFGSTNAITGVWQPAKYTGTYGTNGFYLNFSDNSASTAATIGKDYSGNGNNWTPNNISVTAGVTYDSMTDVPTLTSATAANYAVINPLLVGDYFASGQTTFAITNGNLNYGATGRNAFGSIAVSSGKWYWEMVNTSNTTAATTLFGLVTVASRTAVYACYYNAVNGNKGLGTLNSGATETAYGATWTDNDVIGVAVDMSAATPTVTFYKNNTSQGAISVSSFVGQSVMMWIQNGGNTNNMSGNVNFGQRPFSYTPPTGFVALNTYNLPASTITNGAAYMAATLYNGNGGTQSITNTVSGTSFQPDFVWIKTRSASSYHQLVDSVRGVSKVLNSNYTGAESTYTGFSVTAFNSNGVTLVDDAAASYGVNGSTGSPTYVAWQWKAGTTSASNTNGSITSTVSAGATQGFSVVTYTGNGTGGATVGHGLGVAPSFILAKGRTNVDNWRAYHSSLGNTGALILNATNAFVTNSTFWNNTSPSSTVVTLGSDTSVNQSSNTFVLYCFSAVAGYSAFGSYTGNGVTDGTFVFTNFQPRFIMVKRTDSTSNWYTYDSSRNTANPESLALYPNASYTEDTEIYVDFLSNGFKCRSATVANISGATYIYMAFASNPLKYALAR
jgi:hypothetical protein